MNVFFAILLLSPFGKRHDSPNMNKFRLSSPKEVFNQNLVEIGPVVLEKIFKFRQYIFAIL